MHFRMEPVSSGPIMSAFAPLLGVLIMSAVLVGNFFRAAWTLGILRAFGRRRAVSWRTLGAGAMAACLPLIGVLLTLALVPADDGVEVAMDAAQLALELATSGFIMHLANDLILGWAMAPVAST